MKVVLVASEAVPFAKTGGLADVAGALPRGPGPARRRGQPRHPLLPPGPRLRPAAHGQRAHPQDPDRSQRRRGPGPGQHAPRLGRPRLPDRPPRLLRPPRPLPARRGRLRRQLRAVHLLPACRPGDDPRPRPPPRRDPRQRLADRPDPRLPRRVLPRHAPSSRPTGTLFTIHNMAYQGSFWHWDMPLTGPRLAAVQLAAARVPQPDQLPQVGPGLLRRPEHRQPDLRPRDPDAPSSAAASTACSAPGGTTSTGSSTASTPTAWNPRVDRHLAANYDADTFPVGKAACKAALQ